MSFYLPDVINFITDTPLYTEKHFPPEGILELEFYNGTIDTYCIHCKDDTVFKRNFSYPRAITKTYNTWHQNYSISDITSDNIVRFDVEHQHRVFGKLGIKEYKEYFEGERIIPFDFICSRNDTHHLFFIVSIQKGNAKKFGQFPSLADLRKLEIRKYRKILGDKYKEYVRAIGLTANGIGIGAFVYLRRIFENLIGYARIEAIENVKGWDDEKFDKARMDEKIELLTDYLPNFLVENKSVYGILSKGIHELSEDECLNYYDPLKVAIEIILDEKLESERKKVKIEEASKAINKINSELKSADKIEE